MYTTNTTKSVVPKIGTKTTAKNADLLQTPLPVYKYPSEHVRQKNSAVQVAQDTSHCKHAVISASVKK